MKPVVLVVLAAPFAVELGRLAWRAGNAWFDAWFCRQLKKAWRPGPDNRW